MAKAWSGTGNTSLLVWARATRSFRRDLILDCFDIICFVRYFIKTFGCQMNVADSERVAAEMEARGFSKVSSIEQADLVVVNTCMVRRSAEDRVYGLVRNLSERRRRGRLKKIILTGCMVGIAVRDKSGRLMKGLKEMMPEVDEWLPIEEVGFDQMPLRSEERHALVPIGNGCNNFCSYCVVPFTRGEEVSRDFDEIVDEVKQLVEEGYDYVTLLGQNVNSYGADLVRGLGRKVWGIKLFGGRRVKLVAVRHMGKERVPTLFPYLLAEVAKIDGLKKIDFMSSNPWDFSDELIEVIAKNEKISRQIHLPVQSGSDRILKRMNRWYTRAEYLSLIDKIKRAIPETKFTTDVIVGFPGETEEDFGETVDLAGKVGFEKAYIAKYSPRPRTAALKWGDDVSAAEKKRRWMKLEKLINDN